MYKETAPATCFAAHMGLWHIEPLWFQRSVSMLKAGLILPVAAVSDDAKRTGARHGFTLLDDGTAVIEMHGHLTKHGDSFGSGSTVRMRSAIRAAIRSQDVIRIVLHIDSPGGHVAGTDELARDVKKADSIKPVSAHIEDLCASAAYYVASQARRITANAGAEVGSIGTLMVVHDMSKAAEIAGIDVKVVSTGIFKGAGVPGTEITEEHMGYFRDRVESLNALFLGAVRTGRRLGGPGLRAVTDGRVFIASEAKRLGLIDAVASFDAALLHNQHSTEREENMSLFDAWKTPKAEAVVEALAFADMEDLLKDADVVSAVLNLPSVVDASEEEAARARAEGFAEGKQAGDADAAPKVEAGLAAGVLQGRAEAAKILSMCLVGEQLESAHTLLDVTEDGGFMSVELARSTLQTIQASISERDSIVSTVLPADNTEPEPNKKRISTTAEIYARLEGH